MDSEQCSAIMRLSCAKIVNSRHRRGGANLHKNLLILHVLKRVQETKVKLEIDSHPVESLFVEEDEQEEEENHQPPLEFSVTDCDDASREYATHEPLAFACEAIDAEEQQQKPQPLSLAIDDALSRFGEQRKRKADARPAPCHKTQRVAAERVVPLLRVCK